MVFPHQHGLQARILAMGTIKWDTRGTVVMDDWTFYLGHFALHLSRQ